MFQLGRESQFAFNGTVYVLSRLERRILERFRDWIKEQIGDPFATIKALMGPDLDPAIAKEMITEAKTIKKQLDTFSLGCPLFRDYAGTELGQAELLFLLLQEKQPKITREEAFQIWVAMGQEEFQRQLQTTNGTPPTEKNELPPAE